MCLGVWDKRMPMFGNYRIIAIWCQKGGRQSTLHLSVYIDAPKVSCPYGSLQVFHDARLNIFKSCFQLAPQFLLRSLPILASHELRKRVSKCIFE